MRIVSFLPAATEITYALGAGDELVGRSHECDYPPQVRSLPVVSKPALPLEERDRARSSPYYGRDDPIDPVATFIHQLQRGFLASGRFADRENVLRDLGQISRRE